MDIWLIVVIVLVVLALAVVLAVQGRRRRQEQQRLEAAEHRHEAEIRSASAQRLEAESAERAARAEREQAQAREQAARARQDREVAEARRATADRVDPDVDTRNRDGDGARAGDPAARTDDLRMGGGRHEAGPDDRGIHGPREGDAAGSGPRTGPRQHHDEHAAEPAARTDDLRLGGGRHEGAPDEARTEDARDRGDPAAHSSTGWHGPTATGGFAAPDQAGGPAAPGTQPAAPRQDAERPADDTSGRGRPNVSEDRPAPEVPAQRSGEHDRREPTEEQQHPGPVRSIADRLLRRNG